ncbi:hypothetical protein D3C72_2009520 [compost metagenome]
MRHHHFHRLHATGAAEVQRFGIQVQRHRFIAGGLDRAQQVVQPPEVADHAERLAVAVEIQDHDVDRLGAAGDQRGRVAMRAPQRAAHGLQHVIDALGTAGADEGIGQRADQRGIDLARRVLGVFHPQPDGHAVLGVTC